MTRCLFYVCHYFNTLNKLFKKKHILFWIKKEVGKKIVFVRPQEDTKCTSVHKWCLFFHFIRTVGTFCMLKGHLNTEKRCAIENTGKRTNGGVRDLRDVACFNKSVLNRWFLTKHIHGFDSITTDNYSVILSPQRRDNARYLSSSHRCVFRFRIKLISIQNYISSLTVLKKMFAVRLIFTSMTYMLNLCWAIIHHN